MNSAGRMNPRREEMIMDVFVAPVAWKYEIIRVLIPADDISEEGAASLLAEILLQAPAMKPKQ